MHYRYLNEDDLAALSDLERRVFPERPPSFYRIKRATLSFFARSGHSFAAEEEGAVRGFALAQAVWQGDRATVLATRIAADSYEVYRGLLRVLLKSAYDANAYEVALLFDPQARSRLGRAAADAGFSSTDLSLFSRVLGSRGSRGESAGVLE